MRYLLVLVLCTAASSCSDGTDACGTGLSVSASGGTSPVFSWNPDCGVAAIIVSEDASSSVKWHVESPANEIESGVTFGIAPAGTVAVVPAAPLTPGTVYIVSLGVIRGGSDLPDFVAQASFTP